MQRGKSQFDLNKRQFVAVLASFRQDSGGFRPFFAPKWGKNMKTRVKWVENVSFVGETGSGHAVVIDGAPENGGRNLGMRPMEMVLTGAAACTAFDVVLILKKGRHQVADCVVTAEAERAPEEPRVFTHIHLVYMVAGRGLDPKQVERAVKLSKEKYCSATIMLGRTAEITYEVRITEGDRVGETP
jgi:putative redox protein